MSQNEALSAVSPVNSPRSDAMSAQCAAISLSDKQYNDAEALVAYAATPKSRRAVTVVTINPAMKSMKVIDIKMKKMEFP